MRVHLRHEGLHSTPHRRAANRHYYYKVMSGPMILRARAATLIRQAAAEGYERVRAMGYRPQDMTRYADKMRYSG